jgi:hypothetical protein
VCGWSRHRSDLFPTESNSTGMDLLFIIA